MWLSSHAVVGWPPQRFHQVAQNKRDSAHCAPFQLRQWLLRIRAPGACIRVDAMGPVGSSLLKLCLGRVISITEPCGEHERDADADDTVFCTACIELHAHPKIASVESKQASRKIA